MRSRHFVAALIAAILLALVCCESARCVTTLKFEARFAPKRGAIVTANGVKVLSVHHAPQGALALARQISDGLNVAAEKAAKPEDVKVTGADPLFSVAVADQPIVAVGRILAYSNGSTPAGLASNWADAIKQAFSAAYLTVAATEYTVPLGEARLVPVRGNPKQGLRIEGPSKIVSWKIVPEGVLITANGTGRAKINISSAHAAISISVWAARYAGSIDKQAAAIVTGVSVPRSILAKAALLAARQAALAERGAQIHLGAATVPPPLPAGQTVSATVPVTISGPDYLPRVGDVLVALINQASASWAGDPSVLLVSNNPERLRASGLWYQAPLEPQKAARFLYHHLNGLGWRAALIVEVENPSPSPARVHITEGTGGPSQHEIYSGHVATRLFLSHQSAGVGYVATLPGTSRYAAVVQYLGAGDVASGLLEFRLLDPVPLRLNLRLASPDEAFLLSDPSRQEPARQPAGASFPNPYKKLQGTYTLGGRWLFLSVGRDPLQDDENHELLAGNYGVTYEMRIEIVNPSDHAERAEIAISASAGVAQGVFMIDGAQVETRLLRPYEEAALAKIVVPAAGTRTVKIRTVPEPGSNYPIRIIVRPAVASQGGQSP